MKIIQNRKGNDRVITRIDFQTLRMISEKSRYKMQRDRLGRISSYNFEGGPNISVGSRVEFENMFWRVDEIQLLKSEVPLNEIKMKVTPVY